MSGPTANQIQPADLVSMLGDWTCGTNALYKDLAAKLEVLIREGQLSAERVLPPERSLASALLVSRTTVAACYDALRTRRLVETRQGSGTWVRARVELPPSDSDSRAFPWPNLLQPSGRERQPMNGDVIGLRSTDVPASPVLSEVLETMTPREWAAATAEDGYAPAGLAGLRAALAHDLTERLGLPTTRDELLITTGAQQALHLVTSLFVKPGAGVILEDPTYAGALPLLRNAKARLLPVAVDEHGMQLDQARELMSTRSPSLVYVVPTYHNPTGVLLAEQRRHDLVRVAGEHKIPIVESLALNDIDISPTAAPPPLGALNRRLVMSIGSLSTLFWGGLRIGYIRAPKPVLGSLKRLKADVDMGSGLIAQFIAARLVGRSHEARLHRTQQLQRNYRHLTERLSTEIPEWSWTTPAGGASLWVRIPYGSATNYAQLALRHGVALLAGPLFSATGRHDDRLRIPFVLDERSLSEAVARLREAWLEYGSREGARSSDLLVTDSA